VIELTVLSEAATNRCSVSQLQDMVQYFGTDGSVEILEDLHVCRVIP